ncbi:barstar family protein [Clostridium estertheticum]|uniref:Barnase inhibitor n=1 Tax=Clostridium estertheticum TaxID=238834 RepID=A0A5N7IVB7_9CLOT|nr:barstar family protein [Clostridium estertheticum]MBU3075442.1 barstar family protein [Clostridium estertheticum]MBU3165539.1 barstar family protein [Clostridium estertheticum]MBU3171716.1 barstar family protein [Clostridium estertheticum]MBU3186840.1 barstar family protein [Clostridium estertheticum]MBW9173443.1 barstar family protein [Clostridium estertheticum]
MKKIILDGTQFTSKEKLHAILKSELQLPDYYGNNLDALWDCLTCDIHLPMTIEWRNFECSKALLGDYAEKTLKIFLRTADFLNDDFNIKVY